MNAKIKSTCSYFPFSPYKWQQTYEVAAYAEVISFKHLPLYMESGRDLNQPVLKSVKQLIYNYIT
jgi:hypothetical protein